MTHWLAWTTAATPPRCGTICARVGEAVTERVWPSATNFLLADTSPRPASEVYVGLKARRILVRYFARSRLGQCLRISIGSPREMRALVQELKTIGGFSADVWKRRRAG